MNNRRLSWPRIFLLILLSCPLRALAQEQKNPVAGLASIRQYISAGWDTLTRSMTDCASVVDPKMKVHPVIYLPAGFAAPPAVEKLHTACNVDL
jgi:alpha,alpha-trehalase